MRYLIFLLFCVSCQDVENPVPQVFYRFQLSARLVASERSLEKQDLIFFQEKLSDEQRAENVDVGAFVFCNIRNLSIVSSQPYVRVKNWKLPVSVGSSSAGAVDQLKYIFKDGRRISVFLVSIAPSVDKNDYLQYTEILGRLFMSLEGAGVMAISCKDDNLREVLNRRLKNWSSVRTGMENTSFFCSDNLRWEHEIKARDYGVEVKSKIFQKYVLKDGK